MASEPWVVGTLLAAVALFGFSRIPHSTSFPPADIQASYWSDILPYILMMSFGMGMTFVPLTLTAVHHLRAEDVKQVAEDLERETETVLDHSEDNQAVPHISLSGGSNPQHTAAIAKLEERMDSLEDSVQRWDRTFRKALNTFSDYLQAVSGDLRKSGEP